mmetsp:Transcript_10254/g.42394  ORF Transcript_10254/g.42394 Transcript_10254/m.42394 type:complete len:452 (+) Transcript_10254:552-1907(+)
MEGGAGNPSIHHHPRRPEFRDGRSSPSRVPLAAFAVGALSVGSRALVSAFLATRLGKCESKRLSRLVQRMLRRLLLPLIISGGVYGPRRRLGGSHSLLHGAVDTRVICQISTVLILFVGFLDCVDVFIRTRGDDSSDLPFGKLTHARHRNVLPGAFVDAALFVNVKVKLRAAAVPTRLGIELSLRSTLKVILPLREVSNLLFSLLVLAPGGSRLQLLVKTHPFRRRLLLFLQEPGRHAALQHAFRLGRFRSRNRFARLLRLLLLLLRPHLHKLGRNLLPWRLGLFIRDVSFDHLCRLRRVHALRHRWRLRSLRLRCPGRSLLQDIHLNVLVDVAERLIHVLGRQIDWISPNNLPIPLRFRRRLLLAFVCVQETSLQTRLIRQSFLCLLAPFTCQVQCERRAEILSLHPVRGAAEHVERRLQVNLAVLGVDPILPLRLSLAPRRGWNGFLGT